MQGETEKDDPLTRLQKKLYTSSDVDGVTHVEQGAGVVQEPERWKQPAVAELLKTPKKRMSVATLFLLFGAGFFLIAGITTAVVLFLGGRSISTDNVRISVEEGPITVAGGKATSFSVRIVNNNPLPMTDGTLLIEFPEGTVDAHDASKPLERIVQEIPLITAGGSQDIVVDASFFGSENQKLSIPITLDYHMENSNATFSKKTSYDFTISTSPVLLSVIAVSEVSSGQPLTLVVTARSNAPKDLQNVAVRGDYPFGFLVKETDPAQIADGLYSLGTLKVGEEKEIRITGVLTGQEGEERTFKFSAGSLKNPESTEFGVPYMLAQADVQIAKPFLGVSLTLNRDSASTIVVPSGGNVNGLISWANSLSIPINDARISIKLSGEALDESSVDATQGFYRSSDKTIVFDKSTMSGLGSIQPYNTGNGVFLFAVKPSAELASLRQPTITLSVSVSGKRIEGGRLPETIESTITKTIKVATELGVSGRIVRTVGSIENTGPWPPKADTETTYTVELEARNTINTVAGATLRVQLPSYVRYTGTSIPQGEIGYDSATHELTWTPGNIGAGEVKKVAFQIAFLPSVSQKGTSPILIPASTLSGTDRFTQTTVSASLPSFTTQTATDPNYQTSFGTVSP